jgi:hypothetical protein
MRIFLGFRDLKARRIVNNWATLQNRIAKFGFPPGRLIGPNTRAWTEDEVETWIASRPVAKKPVPVGNRRGRPRKAANAVTTNTNDHVA